MTWACPVSWKFKFYVRVAWISVVSGLNLRLVKFRHLWFVGVCGGRPSFVVALSEQLLPLSPGLIGSFQRLSGDGASAHLFPSLRTTNLVLLWSLRISGSGCHLWKESWLRTRILVRSQAFEARPTNLCS
jgi:hypothetical protein